MGQQRVFLLVEAAEAAFAGAVGRLRYGFERVSKRCGHDHCTSPATCLIDYELTAGYGRKQLLHRGTAGLSKVVRDRGYELRGHFRADAELSKRRIQS